MKKVYLSLWLLIGINYVFALAILCGIYVIPHTIENMIASFAPIENTILESFGQTPLPTIELLGPPQGQSEIVLRKP
jgi:hypothetical protein